jgi:hypothetical protein
VSQPSQNLKNHARYVPLYHFVTVGLVTVLLVRAIDHVRTRPSVDTAFELVLALALVLIAWFARAFALTVQDRVIRLEMRLRMQAIAPAQAARFSEFAPSMLTALRFAGDAELPGLAQQVLDGKLTSGAAVKKQITDWQPDHLRA